MKTVLITGFEPFGGESVNPSWEVVSGLDNAIIGGCRVVARQLPCVFGESLTVLNGAIDALSPSLVLASVSQTAGTFVCNHVMYGLLHKLRDASAVKGGFIHIPYLPQQAAQHPGAPSMATETVRRALEIAIATALQVESDIAVTGGATH